jgi:hypothetical protein
MKKRAASMENGLTVRGQVRAGLMPSAFSPAPRFLSPREVALDDGRTAILPRPVLAYMKNPYRGNNRQRKMTARPPYLGGGGGRGHRDLGHGRARDAGAGGPPPRAPVRGGGARRRPDAGGARGSCGAARGGGRAGQGRRGARARAGLPPCRG